MLDVGLTGGLGSGKSTVAGLLAERGAYVIDADVLARQALAAGSPGLAAVVGALGPGVLRPDGSLDRAELAAVIFHDADARAAVEAVVHPEVARLTRRQRSEAPPGTRVVVHDVPLVVEKGLSRRYDVVVVVECDAATRLARAVARGVPEADARARIAAQATDEERRAAADIVVSNDGDRAALERQVAALWPRLLAWSPARRRGGPVGGAP
jgi:dephospho-CoA kinase